MLLNCNSRSVAVRALAAAVLLSGTLAVATQVMADLKDIVLPHSVAPSDVVTGKFVLSTGKHAGATVNVTYWDGSTASVDVPAGKRRWPFTFTAPDTPGLYPITATCGYSTQTELLHVQ